MIVSIELSANVKISTESFNQPYSGRTGVQIALQFDRFDFSDESLLVIRQERTDPLCLRLYEPQRVCVRLAFWAHRKPEANAFPADRRPDEGRLWRSVGTRMLRFFCLKSRSATSESDTLVAKF